MPDITPGVQYSILDNIHIFSEFNYMMGLINLESETSAQKATNFAFSLTFGVAYTIGGGSE